MLHRVSEWVNESGRVNGCVNEWKWVSTWVVVAHLHSLTWTLVLAGTLSWVSVNLMFLGLFSKNCAIETPKWVNEWVIKSMRQWVNECGSGLVRAWMYLYIGNVWTPLWDSCMFIWSVKTLNNFMDEYLIGLFILYIKHTVNDYCWHIWLEKNLNPFLE